MNHISKGQNTFHQSLEGQNTVIYFTKIYVTLTEDVFRTGTQTLVGTNSSLIGPTQEEGESCLTVEILLTTQCQ